MNDCLSRCDQRKPTWESRFRMAASISTTACACANRNYRVCAKATLPVSSARTGLADDRERDSKELGANGQRRLGGRGLRLDQRGA